MPQERGLYGEETAQKIDAEIKRILTTADDRAGGFSPTAETLKELWRGCSRRK